MNESGRSELVKFFFDFCKQKEVEFVDFRFTDVKGAWRRLSFSASSVDDEVLSGILFDGSSVAAWQPINRSDIMLLPDLVGYFIDPFLADTTVVVFCDVWDIYNGCLYDRCPRSIAKKAMRYLLDSGVGDIAYFGPESEFFVFDDVKIVDSVNCQHYEVDAEEGDWNRNRTFDGGANIGHRPGTKGGYLSLPPSDSMADMRAEIAKVLNQIGIETFITHHEVGQAQGEIGIKFGNMVEAADNVQKLKYVVKMVAHLNGKTATFMPKPLHGDNGSGMHVNISIWKDGGNTFFGHEYGGLSVAALNFLGGVLGHARGVAAFTNASTNSYKRLIPGFEAPNVLTYSAQNRSAGVRIPYSRCESAKRLEFRFPDSSSNPYLAFSALLMAGIDGVRLGTDPGAPMDVNLFELNTDKSGIKRLPNNLRDAIQEMLLDHQYLKVGGVFSDAFIESYCSYKLESEVQPWESRPHPFEFISTYDC